MALAETITLKQEVSPWQTAKTTMLIALLWSVLGFIATPLASASVIITFVLLFLRKDLTKIFMLFLLVLLLSDSNQYFLNFAAQIKPVVVSLCGLLYLIRFAQRGTFDLLKAFLPFLVWAFLICIPSEYAVVSFQKTLSYLFVLLLASGIIYLQYQEGKLIHLIKVYLYVGIGVLIVSLALFLIVPSIGQVVESRMNGLLRNPNGFALFTILFYIISSTILKEFSAEIENHVKLKKLIFALVIVGLLLSGSRTGLMTFGLFHLALWLNRVSPWLLIVVIPSIYFGWEGIFDLITQLLQTLGLQEELRLESINNASGRIYAWQVSQLEIQENHFFVGEGLAFAENSNFMEKYFSILPELIYHNGNIHNVYLTTWINTGLIGLILFLVAWVIVLLRTAKRSLYAIPVFTVVMFLGIYESYLVASLNPYTIQIILGFTLMGLLPSLKNSVDPELSDLENTPKPDIA